MFICTHCHAELMSTPRALRCSSCGVEFPVEDGIADFAEGEYYDEFDPTMELSEEHRRGLGLEVDGAIRRIRDFYAPLLRRAGVTGPVLDCGCGNGVSVDVLAEEGFDAWGNDVSRLRKWQWQERSRRERLVVASGMRLPFPDDAFAALLSSGVLEHIGVVETAAPRYDVTPLPDRRELRIAFLRELGRVVAEGGTIFLDFPNGAFPIDFWHGNAPGSARWHSVREGFLPTFSEVCELVATAIPGARVRAWSPRRRLQFVQAKGHRHGRILAVPVDAFFRIMKVPGFRWLARTAANPFLVIEIRL